MTINFGAAIARKGVAIGGIEIETGIEAVKRSLAQYNEAIEGMITNAELLEVVNDETNHRAVEMAGQAKKLWKAIEAIRKDFIAPHNDYVKAVNALAKGYQGQFGGIEAGLKSKISQYQARVELERRKAEEAARRAAADLQAKLDAEAEAAGVESIQVDAPVIPERDTTTRTAEGAAYQRKTWAFEVLDAAKVPRKYLCVDDGAIDVAVKAGIRKIAGVRIYEETKTVIRS